MHASGKLYVNDIKIPIPRREAIRTLSVGVPHSWICAILVIHDPKTCSEASLMTRGKLSPHFLSGKNEKLKVARQFSLGYNRLTFIRLCLCYLPLYNLNGPKL